MSKLEQANDTENGMSVVRNSVIQLMERVPELEKLENENWYYAEDSIVEFVESLIKEMEKA